MENRPPVSVYIITCISNEERGQVLRDTCANALALNYPEFEVIVSDNAGDIHAEEVLKDLDDPRLKVFRNTENQGFTGNINLCVERCKYDVIKLNCDDDLLHPEFLNITVPYVNDETLVVVDHEQYVIGQEPDDIKAAISEPPETDLRLAGYRDDTWQFPYISLPGCSVFTRQFFLDLGRYDIYSTVTDYDFLISARICKNVMHVKQVLCYMGVWELSATQLNLSTQPFYFTREGLYTTFRLLCDRTLSFKDHMHILRRLLRGFFKESLRLPRNLHRKNYWADYGRYLGLLMEYTFQGKKKFKHIHGAPYRFNNRL